MEARVRHTTEVWVDGDGEEGPNITVGLTDLAQSDFCTIHLAVEGKDVVAFHGTHDQCKKVALKILQEFIPLNAALDKGYVGA